MDREHITEALTRLEARGDWYDSPADFRAGLRCMADELNARLDRHDGNGNAEDDPEKIRAS